MTAANIFTGRIDFDRQALEIFRMQSKLNPVFKNYLEHLKTDPAEINSVFQIPFLPIQLFKSQKVISTDHIPETVFISSGTTGMERSRHFVADLKIYEHSFSKCFEMFYGDISQYALLNLLPSYAEESSLIYMAGWLSKKSCHPFSGFYPDDFEKLFSVMQNLIQHRQKFILLGVTHALLDFAGWLNAPLEGAEGTGFFMETGGMKGTEREMIREEVHGILCNAFGVSEIHSEYGMTELLSQAYSKGKGIFRCPPWMKIFIRDINDPVIHAGNGITGGINIIDLANSNSCSFVSTQDIGRKYADDSFEVLGRIDESDLRGCNLLIQQL